MPKILVVNAAEAFARLEAMFRENGDYHLELVEDREKALDLVESNTIDVVVTDYTGGDGTGAIFLDLMTARPTTTPSIVYSQKASYRHSVEAIKRGAVDYLTADDAVDTVKDAFEKAIAERKEPERRRRKEDQLPGFKFGELVGDSHEMKQVFRTIEKVSVSDSTVLITGESGTGKELIARAIHQNSFRSDRPMVTINCGAIPHELLESELFGHEKGAFTGAHRTRLGRFEMAAGGTIFLDEIGDMSPDLQVKLLRVLQEQTFERVGSTRSIHVDIRVIAATNKDLEASIEEGLFREDLFYRLNVIPIQVPPLRKRKSDIPLLVNFFMNRMGGRRREDLRRMKSFSDEALQGLMVHDWPGNVRELENMMERLSVLVEGDVIHPADLPEHIRGKGGAGRQPAAFMPAGDLGFGELVDQYQKALILDALEEANWVKAKAAERLKMNRTTLVEKIKKLKVEAADEASDRR
jgi:DNA-binding NtrC family response regulator